MRKWPTSARRAGWPSWLAGWQSALRRPRQGTCDSLIDNNGKPRASTGIHGIPPQPRPRLLKCSRDAQGDVQLNLLDLSRNVYHGRHDGMTVAHSNETKRNHIERRAVGMIMRQSHMAWERPHEENLNC